MDERKKLLRGKLTGRIEKALARQVSCGELIGKLSKPALMPDVGALRELARSQLLLNGELIGIICDIVAEVTNDSAEQ